MGNSRLLNKLNGVRSQFVYHLNRFFGRPGSVGIDTNNSVCYITDSFDDIEIMPGANLNLENRVVFGE